MQGEYYEKEICLAFNRRGEVEGRYQAEKLQEMGRE